MAKRYRILLVEDSEGDVCLFNMVFKKINPDCEITVCSDGEEALEYIHNQENRPEELSLIILDINLPRVDGVEVLKEIKTIPRLEDVCVAAYSSSSDPNLKKTVYQNGAYYFMIKPFDLNRYLAEISSLYAACLGSKS